MKQSPGQHAPGRHPPGLGKSYGDEIMAAGQAERIWRETGRRVCITDPRGRPRWSPVWQGNPAIAEGLGPDIEALVNAPGARPYLVYPWSRATGVRFTGWRAADHPARLWLSDNEAAVAADLRAALPRLVLLEPLLAAESNPNKQWGLARWQSLAAALTAGGWQVAQLGAAGAQWLEGVLRIEAQPFRAACVALAAARMAVLPEGGLHHAAAALKVPAVVIFGGAIPVEVTGYPGHVNIGRAPVCGSWAPCAHCTAAMASIGVQEVLDGVAALRAGLDLEAPGRPVAAGLPGRLRDAAARALRGGGLRRRRGQAGDGGGDRACPPES